MSNQIVDYQLKTDRTIVYISSQNRTRGSASEFFMNMMPYIKNARMYRVKSIIVPNSWYVFRSGTNVFGFNTGVDGNLTVTIPAGNYTTTTLKTTLETLMNAAMSTGTVTITFNSTTNKMELAMVGDQIGMNTPNLQNGANPILGWTSQQLLSVNLTANNVYNLSGESDIYLRSQALRDEESMESRNNGEFELSYTNIIHRIPVLVNSNSVIIDQEGSPWLDYPNNKITQLDFRLTFKDGEVVNLNGQEFSFVLEFLGRFN